MLGSKTRSHPPACIQNRAHIQDLLTSKTRSHPKPAHIPSNHHTVTASPPPQRRHPTRSHPLISNNASLIHHPTPYCSPFNHQTAVSNHRVDAIQNRAENRGTSLATVFPPVTPARTAHKKNQGKEGISVQRIPVRAGSKSARTAAETPRWLWRAGGVSALPIGGEDGDTPRRGGPSERGAVEGGGVWENRSASGQERAGWRERCVELAERKRVLLFSRMLKRSVRGVLKPL